MHRYDLSDEQWARLAPLLPPQKPPTGRPNHDHRPIINGIQWFLRTGAPCQDLPERYGSYKTVSSRFYRWRAAGIWDRILAALQRQADQAGRVDWNLHFVDSTIIRAHQHAAGAKGGTYKPKRSVAHGADSAPRSTSGQKGTASRSSSS